ncbi:MAG: hypothetical protein ABIG11_07900 [bacterium]
MKPARRLKSISAEYLDKTIARWQAYCGKKLKSDDAGELAENLIALEILLKQLRGKYG